jgi:hypothetical protein
MKPKMFVETVTFRASREQRAAIDQLADCEQMSVGEAAREFLNLGIKARRIESVDD